MSKEDFVNKYYAGHNLTQFLEDARKNDKLDPITILSYKNRPDAYLLHWFLSNPISSDILCFVYEDDYTASRYNKIVPNNFNFIKINQKDFEKYGLEWRSSQTKRSYIQHWMHDNGYNHYFSLDDDICRKDGIFARMTLYKDENGKNVTENINIIDGLKLLQLAGSYFDDWCLLGITGSGIIQRTTKFRGLLSTKIVHGNYYINGKILAENDLWFTNSVLEREDNVLHIDIVKKDLYSYCLDSIAFFTNGKTTFDKNKYHRINLYEYIKHYPFMKFSFGISMNDGFELYTHPDTKLLTKFRNSHQISELITEESEKLLKYAKEGNIFEIEKIIVNKKIKTLKDPSIYKKLKKYI